MVYCLCLLLSHICKSQLCYELSNYPATMQNSFLAIERVFELLDAVPEIKDKKGAIALPKFKKQIEFYTWIATLRTQ